MIQKTPLTLLITLGLSATGCFENGTPTALTKGASTSTSSSSTTPAVTANNYIISTVSVASSGTGTSATLSANLFFDVSRSSGPISNSCNISNGTTAITPKSCACRFSWQEINTTAGTSVSIPRTVQTTITNIQPNLIVCNAPSVYSAEIPDNTTLKITVVPSGQNTSSFSVPVYNFVKKTTTSTSFQDFQGRGFENIHRYSCYDENTRGLEIKSKLFSVTNPAGTSEVRQVPYATQFCLVTRNNPGDLQDPTCAGLNGAQNSSQANYYNLYIRNSDVGAINVENPVYKCPRVQESLGSIGTVGSSNNFWPLDSQFALAVSSSPDFPIGVEARSKLSDSNQPAGTNVNTSCFTSSGTGGTSSGATAANGDTILSSCLGFAAKPNPDGSCPYIRDATGSIRNTYRLRRFIALYPQFYDTDGKLIPSTSQASDTVYVLDRPVYSPSADPLKPYTMRGPKPCPFAYFDQKGVLTTDASYPSGMPSYVATNNAAWNGVNVDGIEFPRDDVASQSCSAAVPLLNDTRTILSVGTVNSSNPMLKRLFMRPIQAWAPHYEEDLDFQACAPQSSNFRDPPLHFSRDTTNGNIAWCAEAYPTQNPNVADLDVKVGGPGGSYPGKVVPFTSHISKNSSSADCTATKIPNLPTGYPAPPNGYANHLGNPPGTNGADSFIDVTGALQTRYADRTCDRTAQGGNWTKFPLLARPGQVETAIASDSTYSCMISFDNGAKTGKQTPSAGCCGSSVQMQTGLSGSPGPKNVTSAHLEPDVGCLVPNY